MSRHKLQLQWLFLSLTVIVELFLLYFYQLTYTPWLSILLWSLFIGAIFMANIGFRRNPAFRKELWWGFIYGTLAAVSIVVLITIYTFLVVGIGGKK